MIKMNTYIFFYVFGLNSLVGIIGRIKSAKDQPAKEKENMSTKY